MPEYKFHYFNIRARGELVRLLFAAGGVKFTDKRVEFAEWASLKAQAPIGQLPYLEIDGKSSIPQSIATARYVARETKLYPADSLSKAQTDALVDTCTEVLDAVINKALKTSEDAERAEKLKAFINGEDAKNELAKLEKLITLYGEGHFSVGKELSWADLAVYNSASFMVQPPLLPLNVKILDSYPKVKAVYNHVETLPGVAEYLKNRPVTSR